MDYSKSPINELEDVHEQMQTAINDLIKNYSVETWKKYLNANVREEKANINFGLIVNHYNDLYGSVIECKETAPTYIKQLNLFKGSKYYWRWESECTFEKGTGRASVDFSILRNV